MTERQEISVPEERIGKVRSWSEMQIYINRSLPNPTRKILRSYTRAQTDIAVGRKTRAKQLLNILDKRFHLEECEMENSQLFRLIDIAVRGQSNRLG